MRYRNRQPLLLLIAFIAFHFGQACNGDPEASNPSQTYPELKKDIVAKRKAFAQRMNTNDSFYNAVNLYWIQTLGTNIYLHWKNTPWDFNGTTQTPGEGNIACGFFVTTVLQDMDLVIKRRELATCASSQMMKALVPGQKIRNLSSLSYSAFTDALAHTAPGVYVIGLDFHTGFIVNDGSDRWFIHSNYIGRKGVTKERIEDSDALKASKTRWVVALTNDRSFLRKWLSHED